MKHDHAQFIFDTDFQGADLPQLIVQCPDETYVTIGRYDREAIRNNWPRHRSDLKILVLSPSGDGYLQPRAMCDLDSIRNTTHLHDTLAAAGLSKSYAESGRWAVPPILAQIEADLFVAGAPTGILPERIFVERTPQGRSGSGSFMSLKMHRQYRPNAALTPEQSKLLEPEERSKTFHREKTRLRLG